MESGGKVVRESQASWGILGRGHLYVLFGRGVQQWGLGRSRIWEMDLDV